MSAVTRALEKRELATAPVRQADVGIHSAARSFAKPLFDASRRGRVGVFGHFGNENLGDESIIQALFTNLRLRIQHAEFVAFSARPDDTTRRHGVTSYPIRRISSTKNSGANADTGASGQGHSAFWSTTCARLEAVKCRVKRHPLLWRPLRASVQLVRLFATWMHEVVFLLKSFQILHTLDLLIVAGSNQFLDNFGGPWGFPYTLLKWTVLARLAGVKVIYLNVGAGPLSHPLSKTMVRCAINRSHYLSVRDTQSQRLLEANGIYQGAAVHADLAFSLPPRPLYSTTTRIVRGDSPLVVGINPMPIYDRRYWCVANPLEYTQYVRQLAKFSLLLLDDDCSLTFWSTQPRDQNVITDVVSAIHSKIGRRYDDRLRVAQPTSVETLLQTIETCDIAVATRFHGVVLSLFCERPVLAISYHPKMQDLMLTAGQGEFALPFEGLDSTEMFKRFTWLRRKRQQVTADIRKRRSEYAERLHAQYDRLFGPVTANDNEFDRQEPAPLCEVAQR